MPVRSAATTLVPPAASLPAMMPWWRDPRFYVPAAFVGASLLAVGAFALAGRWGRKKDGPLDEIVAVRRDDVGYAFAEQGYVLCPQALGFSPTGKSIRPGTFVVLWLATAAGRFVERTWAEVLALDPDDPGRIYVVIRGELGPAGQQPLRGEEHGFRLGQSFWMSKDCISEAYNGLRDLHGTIPCGAELMAFEEAPLRPPSAPADLVGWIVDLLLVSREGHGAKWQVPVTAKILSVGPSGDVPRVEVLDVQRNWEADDPVTGHKVAVGDEFDVTWDCILGYTEPD